MNLLARREHSETELFRKLRTKGFDEATIGLVITQLVSENLVSNSRFIENYIHSRRIKGFGPLKIQAELQERGVLEELIEHHLQIADNAWFAEAREAWKKRFKNRMPTDFKSRSQQMRFLYYRGFTSEQIEYVFKHLMSS